MSPLEIEIQADVQRLSDIRRLVHQLQRAAYLFERLALPTCNGDCDQPVEIAYCDVTGDWIDCCTLRHTYQQYTDARKVEAALNYKVSSRKRC